MSWVSECGLGGVAALTSRVVCRLPGGDGPGGWVLELLLLCIDMIMISRTGFSFLGPGELNCRNAPGPGREARGISWLKVHDYDLRLDCLSNRFSSSVAVAVPEVVFETEAVLFT